MDNRRSRYYRSGRLKAYRVYSMRKTLETAEIPKLSEHDNSDEDGNSVVGDYSILITDESGKPVFNSEISIDANDNLTIILPDGRLLSAEDITTITVLHKDTQQPAEGLNIFIADTSTMPRQAERTQTVSYQFPTGRVQQAILMVRLLMRTTLM